VGPGPGRLTARGRLGNAVEPAPVTRSMTALEDKLHSERETLRRHALEIRHALALPARASHAEVLAAIAELAADQPVRRLRDDERPHRLALVPTEDPPLELARQALLDAVLTVPGVEWATVRQLDSDQRAFFLDVCGGADEVLARAVLRTFPMGTIVTVGTQRIEVDGEAVWLCRSSSSGRDLAEHQ